MNSTTAILLGISTAMGSFTLEAAINETMDISSLIPVSYGAQIALSLPSHALHKPSATFEVAKQIKSVIQAENFNDIEVGGYYIVLDGLTPQNSSNSYSLKQYDVDDSDTSHRYF